MVLYALRDDIVGRRLAAYARDALQRETGMAVTVGPVTGSYLRGIDIQQIRLHDDQGKGPVRELSCGPVHIRYFPLDLLAGVARFVRNGTVSVRGFRLRMTPAADATASAAPHPTPSAVMAALSSLPPLPTVALSDAEISLDERGPTVTVASARLGHQKGHPGRITLDVSGGALTRADGHQVRIPPATAALSVVDGKLHLSPVSVDGDWLTLNAEVDLIGRPEAMAFTVNARLAGAPIQASGTWRNVAVDVAVDAKALDLEALATRIGLTAPAPAAGLLSVRGNASIPFQNPRKTSAAAAATLLNSVISGIRVPRIEVTAETDGAFLTVARGIVHLPGNRITVASFRVPLDPLWRRDIASAVPDITADMTLEGTNAAALRRVVAAALPPALPLLADHTYRFGLSLSSGILTVSEGVFSAEAGTLSIRPSTLRLPAPLAEWRTAAIDIHADARFTDIRPISEILGLPLHVGGALSAAARLSGSLGAPRGAVSIDAGGLTADDITIGDITLAANGDAGALRIERFDWRNATDRLTMTGRLDLPRGHIVDATAAFGVTDPLRYVPRRFRHRLPAIIAQTAPTGTATGRITATGPVAAPDLTVETRIKNLRWEGRSLGSVDLDARMGRHRIQVTRLAVVNGPDRVDLSGTLDMTAEHLEALRVSLTAAEVTPYLELAMSKPAPVHGGLTASISASGPVRSPTVQIQAASEALDGGGVKASAVTLAATAGPGRRVHVAQLAATVADTHIRAAGTVTWPASAEGFQLDLEALSATYADARLALESPAVIAWSDHGRLSATELALSGTDGATIRLQGDVPAAPPEAGAAPPSPVRLKAAIALPRAAVLNPLLGRARIGTGRIEATVTVSGDLTRPLGAAHVEVTNLVLSDTGLPLPPGPLDLYLDARYADGAVTLDPLRISSPAVTVSGRGTGYGLRRPAMSAPGAGGPDATISLTGELIAERLDWLAAAIPGVRSLDGRLSVSVQLSGAAASPDITAAISLSEGGLRAEGRLPAIENVSLTAALKGGHLHLAQLDAMVGGAPLKATGRVSGILTAVPDVTLNISGDNLLLYRTPGLRVRGNTALSLSGPLTRLRLSGDVVLTDGLYSQHIDYLSGLTEGGRPQTGGEGGVRLFSIRKSPLNAMQLDVGVTAEKAFAVRSNIVKGTLRPDLRLVGTAETPLIKGRLLVDTARLRLPAGRMLFENGLLQFGEGAPNQPALDLVGAAKMFGYDVRLVAEGALDAPVITLSATPPLASEEILLMLLTGAPPSNGDGTGDIRRQGLNVTVFIGQDLLSRWLGNGDGEASLLDRFDVQVGREITQTGEETVETQFRLAENVFRKGDTLYLTGEKDVFDYYNAGVRLVFKLE